MNVTLPKKILADSLGHVERIIPHRSSNPGLSLLKVEVGKEQEHLTLSGSNMDVDIEAHLAADISRPLPGPVALPAQVFAQIVRALPGELVELSFEDGELEIRSGSYATKLQLAEAGQAPSIAFPATYPGRLAGKTLAKALAHVRYAAAVAEYQAIFRGVKLELANKRTRAVATDGFRLAYYHSEEASGLEGELVLPARSADELVKLLGDGEAQLELAESQLSVASGPYRLNLKLMEGTFPDYERVIPSQFPVSISLNAKAFAEAVSRVAVMADKSANNRIDLFIQDGSLQITSEGGYGRSQETLEVKQEGEESQIALAYNAKYLVDALQPVEGELRASFSGPTSPSVLVSLEDPSYLAMVVPLRTG